MGNELAKALKRKTDAQFRVTSEDQAPGVVETTSGQVILNDPSTYMVPYVAGKNVSMGNSGSSKVINAIMNILAGDNVSVSAPDENGAVRISSSIGGKSIDLTGLTDGYVLTYDSLTDTIMLKPAAGSISQATDTVLGGVRAKAKTTETAEVAIDSTTGKLYAPASSGENKSGASSLVNVCRLLPVVVSTTTSSDINNFNGVCFNGDRASANYINIGHGTRDIILDFGRPIKIEKILWWLFYSDGRTFRNVALYGKALNTDSWTELRAPSNWVSNADGLGVVISPPVSYRYLKFYAEGNVEYNSNEYNEIEVYSTTLLEATNGIPAGGSAGQVLSKIDNEDYNAQWVSQSPISTGANPIDEPPSSPSPMDDEFDDITLDPKWIWINQGAATWVENGQSGMMDLLSGVDHTRLLVQAAPSGDFIAVAKVSILCPRIDYMNFGICLYNNTNGKRVIFGKCTRNNYSGMQVIKFNSDTQYSSDPYLNGGWDSSAVYVRIKKNGTSYYLDMSIDGSFWWTVFTESLSVFLATITHVGLGYFRNNTNGVNYKGKCEFFRVTNL